VGIFYKATNKELREIRNNIFLDKALPLLLLARLFCVAFFNKLVWERRQWWLHIRTVSNQATYRTPGAHYIYLYGGLVDTGAFKYIFSNTEYRNIGGAKGYCWTAISSTTK
jgi:hypothetical protein